LPLGNKSRIVTNQIIKPIEESLNATILDKQHNLNFLLVKEGLQHPFLLFRAQVGLFGGSKFQELAGIVN
jgi:hypothetical protein